MMTAAAGVLDSVHVESARLVAGVYATSLLVVAPMAVAAVAAGLLRRSSAEARAAVWRAAIVAVLVVIAGRELPVQWVAWIVPSFFAAPFVALGRVQVTADSAQAVGFVRDAAAATAAATTASLLLAIYVGGVLLAGARTLLASLRLGAHLRGGRRVDASYAAVVHDARQTLRCGRRARLYVSPAAIVPMTWGWLRPVIVLPSAFDTWTTEQQRMAIMHELAHVRAADWLFDVAGRVASALLWFHPGVWYLVRALREERERACDDRVIAAGARRSDYAELLMHAAAGLPGAALALSTRSGLRARLAAVLDARHAVRPLARGWAAAALVASVAASAPIGVVQLAPTRGVLTRLMLDSQWESRAYAVLGLAQRADSVAVARSAAELDPSPRVRAWARYALDQQNGLPALLPITRDQ